MKRNIIAIDTDKCTGCGLCIPNCPEGALQIIDGKARLVSDLQCDGLGACLGHCPEGAITIEEREAVAYDEALVMGSIVKQGEGTIAAHLNHLKEHGQTDYYREALRYLTDHGIAVPHTAEAVAHAGCPGSRAKAFSAEQSVEMHAPAPGTSRLSHWPVQMHLLSPHSPHFKNSDFVLAADCTAFALGAFHDLILTGKTLGIACPKLDDAREIYREKIRMLIDDARISSLTVVIMEVPCCGGLLRIAQEAAELAQRKVPVKCVTVGIQGGILGETPT